ncbi:MAG: carbohydrate ABC transporter permease [Clostridiales bacterium]|nr:carbohydrate ABC transporter permease [Clostridiales bacterium]
MSKQTSSSKLHKTDWFDVLNVILLLLLGLIVIIPFYFTIIRSFLTQQEYVMSGTPLWPENPTIGNYRDIFIGTGMLRSFFNSVLYTVLGTAFSMFLATTMAYGLSKKNYPGRGLFQSMIIFTMYFGGGTVPFFLLLKDLGLYGNRYAVVIALAFNAFNMIILRNFFEALPPDLEEAAMLDGASPFRIFWQIVLPLMKPALATVTLYFVVDRWNEWFWSSLVLIDRDMWPMQLELRQIMWSSSAMAAEVPAELGRKTYAEGMKAAAVIVTMLPIMCIYPFLQKYFAKGVMIGAIKS